MKKMSLAILILLVGNAGSVEAQVQAVDLRCEGMAGTPVVGSSPHLAWRLESKQRNQQVSAWQILVANSRKSLTVDAANLWDSGKTPSTRSSLVRYAGKPLSAGQTCFWKVRVWDANDRASDWSEVASWQVAPVAPADWSGAKWIDDGMSNPNRDQDFYQPDPAPLFRREFKLEKPVVSARLHIAGLGWCVPSMNGARVNDCDFSTPWTNFDKRILFSTYDVTRQLVPGSNCMGIELGNGWYNPLPLKMWGHRNIRGSLPTGRPRAIALLVVEHADGTTTQIVTDSNWKTSTGSVLSNSVYLGEVRDARKQQIGWRKPGFDDAVWQPANVAQASLEPLKPRIAPAVQLQQPIPASKITSPAEGVHIVDFGQNLTGVAEVTLDVPAGTKIEFRYGELLNEDGSLNPMTSVCGQIKGVRKNNKGDQVRKGGPGAPAIAWQGDKYFASGGGETFRPDFTFHGFRYMEVKGLTQPPKQPDFHAFPVRSDLKTVGEFECSNERLNRIHEMCRRTFLANVVGVQSDCPHRERFAYGGDIVATSESFIMNFDMSGFYAKTIRDWSDAAKPDGRFTDTAPFVGIDYCGVGWSMVHPWLLEQHYQHYGSKELLRQEVPKAIRWLDGEASRRKNDLVVSGLGDHEALSKIGGPVLTTPLFISAARRVGRLATIVGLDDDARRCQRFADESADAWAKSFLDKETGKVGAGTQSMQAFALGFEAADEDDRPKVFNRLVEQLDSPNGPKLTTGIFGTQCLLEQLSIYGRSDLSYALANRNEFPSWGWMLENDATTLWEHWAGGDNTYSHNHPMFGSISGWFFRWLGGIQAAPDAIGFDRIVIRPQVVSGLEWVKCSHQSVRGKIESNWSTVDGKMDFEIVIPPGTTAVVELPRGEGNSITESGIAVEQIQEIEVLSPAQNSHRLSIGSGKYNFTITSD